MKEARRGSGLGGGRRGGTTACGGGGGGGGWSASPIFLEQPLEREFDVTRQMPGSRGTRYNTKK